MDKTCPIYIVALFQVTQIDRNAQFLDTLQSSNTENLPADLVIQAAFSHYSPLPAEKNEPYYTGELRRFRHCS